MRLSPFRRSHAFTLTRLSLALIYSLPSLCQLSWPCSARSYRRIYVEPWVLKQYNEVLFLKLLTSGRFWGIVLVDYFLYESELLLQTNLVVFLLLIFFLILPSPPVEMEISSGLAGTDLTSIVNGLFVWSSDIVQNAIWKLKFDPDDSSDRRLEKSATLHLQWL